MRRNRPKEYREAQRLLAGMKRDGVPLGEKSVMQAVEHPHWERAAEVHDWRAHVPGSIREAWLSLPLTTRLCVFETAELTALGEERGAVMVTGPAGPGTTS
jgi:hypothetical protein